MTAVGVDYRSQTTRGPPDLAAVGGPLESYSVVTGQLQHSQPEMASMARERKIATDSM